MPTRPAIHQPHFAKSPEQRAAIERERQRVKDAERPSPSQRGYDAEWRELRARFVALNPVCSVPGCGKPTVDVDHVADVRAHPGRRLDSSNLRPFCHPHHSQRTAREQGFAGRHDGPTVSKRAAVMPDWLRPSRVPLRIVCGPPASGKTTYCEAHAGYTEVVLDLNEIRAQLSGLPVYQPGLGWLNEALRHRNSALGELGNRYCKLGGAWLIVGAPKLTQRQWWRAKLQPLSCIVLAVPAAVCHARIDGDPRRAMVRDQHHAAVEAWWRDFTHAPGERIATANAPP